MSLSPSAPASRAGSMTSAMRAVAPVAGPRLLRVGLVQGGRVIEERVIAPRGHLTVGVTEECQFVVAGAAVPRGFRLFERRGGELRLHLLEGMRGRVAEAAGVRRTLTAAAMTYVAGALAALAQLLYFLLRFGGR